MAKRRAETVSLKKLATTIEKAVQQADTNDLVTGTGLQLQPGIIFGRFLRGEVTLEAAQTLAADITGRVERTAAPGIGKLDPAVLKIKNRIIVGFIDPSRLGPVIEV
jgi:hypothetical protein